MSAMLLAALLAVAPQHDTVFMEDGGRVVGTVTEEGPQGVTVQLLDGTVRTYPAREVLRVEYSDGTVSTPRSRAGVQPPAQPVPRPPTEQPPAAPPQREAPPPPPPQYPPPPGYQPSPRYPPPPYAPYPPPPMREQRARMAPISPVYAVLGFGGLGMYGDVEEGVATDRVFEPELQVWLEAGIRVTPRLSLGAYLGLGYGDAAAEWRSYCASYATTCSANTDRAGLLVRWSFDPQGRTSPWVAAGTGWESGTVTFSDSHMGGLTYGSSDLFTYSGWEALRLMAGVDLRSTPVVGVGLYGAVSWGRYDHFENANGPVDLGRQPFHTTLEAGLRFTLFP